MMSPKGEDSLYRSSLDPPSTHLGPPSSELSDMVPVDMGPPSSSFHIQDGPSPSKRGKQARRRSSAVLTNIKGLFKKAEEEHEEEPHQAKEKKKKLKFPFRRKHSKREKKSYLGRPKEERKKEHKEARDNIMNRLGGLLGESSKAFSVEGGQDSNPTKENAVVEAASPDAVPKKSKGRFSRMARFSKAFRESVRHPRHKGDGAHQQALLDHVELGSDLSLESSKSIDNNPTASNDNAPTTSSTKGDDMTPMPKPQQRGPAKKGVPPLSPKREASTNKVPVSEDNSDLLDSETDSDTESTPEPPVDSTPTDERDERKRHRPRSRSPRRRKHHSRSNSRSPKKEGSSSRRSPHRESRSPKTDRTRSRSPRRRAHRPPDRMPLTRSNSTSSRGRRERSGRGTLHREHSSRSTRTTDRGSKSPHQSSRRGSRTVGRESSTRSTRTTGRSSKREESRKRRSKSPTRACDNEEEPSMQLKDNAPSL